MLVGCFGINGPLRQYFSLYRAVPKGEGERKEKMIDEIKNVQTTPYPHPPQAQQALALLSSKLVGRPGIGSLPSTIASPDHPLLLKTLNEMYHIVKLDRVIKSFLIHKRRTDFEIFWDESIWWKFAKITSCIFWIS